MSAVSPRGLPLNDPEIPEKAKNADDGMTEVFVNERILPTDQQLPPQAAARKPPNSPRTITTNNKTYEATKSKLTGKIYYRVIVQKPKTDDELKNEMKTRAQATLEDPGLDSGRKEVATEIVNKPEQLLADIHRFGTLSIGDETIKAEELVSKSSLELCDMVKDKLKDYIASTNSDLVLSECMLDELLYVMTQTFSGNAEEMFHKDEKLPIFEWGADKDKTRISTSYKMEEASGTPPNTIIVTRRTEKHYIRYEDLGKPDAEAKRLRTDATIRYDLQAKSVTFRDSYELVDTKAI